MIVYDVATKELDTESFPQHAIADLNSGITFIVLFSQEKPLRWKGINTQISHTHTHTHTHQMLLIKNKRVFCLWMEVSVFRYFRYFINSMPILFPESFWLVDMWKHGT